MTSRIYFELNYFVVKGAIGLRASVGPGVSVMSTGIENLPNETLYVRNLDDKIKEPRLKESLYGIFSSHGKVLQVLLMKAHRLRGQAWVTFEDVPSASAALRALDGTMHFGKAMNVQFAREKNDLIRMREPNAKPREKRKREEKEKKDKQRPLDKEANKTKAAPVHPNHHSSAPVLPHKILFLQDVPEICNQEALSTLFKQYHGFKEVRMVPGKKGLAFVEYFDEVQASIALQGLNGFKLSADERLKVSFAKK
jgi:U2 small nuclear ribonucleoprotein B''